MEIVLGKTAGFCFGVNNVVAKTEKLLDKYKGITCLGELVHNGEVIKDLEDKGLHTIDNLDKLHDKRIIIRAHGEPAITYELLKERNVEVFDFTCPKVLKIHEIVSKYAKKGYHVFLIGVKKHPESIGTISYCGKNSYLIEDEKDIINGIEQLKTTHIKKLLIIAQTTFNLEKFESFVNKIGMLVDNEVTIEVKNTICGATRIRQEETENISKEVDCMIIVGGKNSSNTKKLYEIANKYCKNTYIVETKDEIEKQDVQNFNKIGIMAGASTPTKSINEVIEKISN